jgi:flagellar FliJ protein
MPPATFKFRFAALLRYRKRILDRLALELAQLQRDLLERQAELGELERRHSTCTGELAARVRDKLDAEVVIMYHRYLELLAARMGVIREEIAFLDGKVHDKTEQVVAASKQKKIVEKIRERDKLGFLKLVAETERKVLDEVGANRASGVGRDLSRADASRIA